MTAPEPTDRFAELMARPVAEISPGEAALLIAAHAHPALDVDAWVARLGELAENAPVDPAALARHLFVVEGFTGNRVDYGDPRNSYLDDVLTRRLGIPITLSVVMIEVGRRVGVVVEGVGMPGHFLVRASGDAGEHRYFDPFDRGAELTEAESAGRFAELHPAAPFDVSYLDPVGAHAIVTRMLANLEQTLLTREPSAVVWVVRLRLLVPGLSPDERRRLAARLGALGAFGAAADVLDALSAEAGAAGRGERGDRDEAAARALPRPGELSVRPVASELPMFPLGTVLFPHAPLPLHVFEPRYRALVEVCLAGVPEFGVVLIERGSEVGGGDTRFDVGTVARIQQVGRADDGRYVLGTVGTRRVRVVRWLDDAPYPRAEVDPFDDPPETPDPDVRTDVERLLTRVLALRSELGEPVGVAPALHDDAVRASYEVAALAGVGPLDAQELLAAQGASERMHLAGRMLEERREVLEAHLGRPGPRPDDAN